MTPQLGASLTIIILMTLEVSFMLLELSIMLKITFIAQTSLMTIVIYNHLMFIVHRPQIGGSFPSLMFRVRQAASATPL